MPNYSLFEGILNFSTAIDAQKKHRLSVDSLKNLHNAANIYYDDNVILIAPVILTRSNLVIAANPICERDHNTLHAFSSAWLQDQINSTELIENHMITCSIAIYTRDMLVLVRDRIGTDSIFYTHHNEQISFSNNSENLLEKFCHHNEELDVNSALNYLLYGRPRVGNTLCKSVKSLPAAHFMTSCHNNISQQRYWSPQLNPMPLGSREFRLNRLQQSLEQSCRNSFSKKSNAIFLSGGLDSSYIAYIAGQSHRKTTCCYTISYVDKQYSDESHYAQIICEAYGLPLKKIELSSENILQQLKLILNQPQPASAWASICNNALVDAAVKDGNINILSGLGSDEVLANYDKALDYYFRVREFINRANTGEQDLLQHVDQLDELLFPGVADFFTRDSLESALTSDIDINFIRKDLRDFYSICGPVNQSSHLFSHIVAHECHHRIPDLLLRNFNVHSMRQGAQISYPFLDPDFVEHACSLYPQERFLFQDNKWHSKISLKLILADLLPSEILQRKRGTFDFPFKAWLKHDDFYLLVRDTLEQSPIWNTKLFKENVLTNYLDFIQRNRDNKSIDNPRWPTELWALVTLCAWYRNYIS